MSALSFYRLTNACTKRFEKILPVEFLMEHAFLINLAAGHFLPTL